MLRDDFSARTSSSLLISSTSPTGAPLGSAGWPSAVPKPPNTTFKMDRFIARHMLMERIAPEAPTSAPVTMSRSFASMKPAAAAAQPEYELSSDTTTGMSAPPMATTR